MNTRTISPPIAGSLSEVIVRVPGSKSIANRALVCAMLANGESFIQGLPDGDDTAVIINALAAVGRVRTIGPGTASIQGSTQGNLPGIIDAALAGTSSRFLTAVAALGDGTTLIDGGGPLRLRPMFELHNALTTLGAIITPLGDHGHLPVSVSRGELRGGEVNIRGDVSSQFISALMLIGPVLQSGLTLVIDGELVSRSYVQMTASVMSEFGANVEILEDRVVVAPSGYVSKEFVIEPDFSSAAFPIVAAVVSGIPVRIPQLNLSRLQGDAEILEIAREMGAEIFVDGDDIVVSRDLATALQPINVDMQDCSDLVPAVVVACALAHGVSAITGVGFIRNKESDRLGDLAVELTKSGAKIQVDNDGLTIHGVGALHSAKFDTHHDHRLAMSFALVALSAGTVDIDNAHVVSKSWPTYFEDMKAILGD